jgi:hypothetical protein
MVGFMMLEGNKIMEGGEETEGGECHARPILQPQQALVLEQVVEQIEEEGIGEDEDEEGRKMFFHDFTVTEIYKISSIINGGFCRRNFLKAKVFVRMFGAEILHQL